MADTLDPDKDFINHVSGHVPETANPYADSISQSAMEKALSGIAIADQQGNIQFANLSFRKSFDLANVEDIQDFNLYTAWESREKIDSAIRKAIDEGHWSGELATAHAQDKKPLLLLTTLTKFHRSGDETALIVCVQDISFYRQSLEDLLLASTILQTSTEAIMITDANCKIVAINPAFTERTGYSEDEVIGLNPRILNAGRQQEKFFIDMWSSIKNSGKWEGEIWNRRKTGEVCRDWLNITAFYTSNNELSRYVGVLSDITRHKDAEELITWYTNYDALTELPNRNLFIDRLENSLAFSDRNKTKLAIMLVGLSRFKMINDTLGHSIGDQVLRETAARINSAVRKADSVARIGGDEFAVILPNIAGADCLEKVARRIIDTLAKPFTVGDQATFLSCNVGIAIYPEDGRNPDTLIKHMNVALHRAKEQNQSLFFFEADMNTKTADRVRMEGEMRRALENNEFCLYYQPLVDLSTGRISGCEALIRWEHPENGLIPPFQFIPVAEETGLIIPIGHWVFKTAIAQAKKWQSAGYDNFRVSVNLSSLQVKRPRALSDLRNLLLSNPGHLLTVEITETLLMEHTNLANEFFGEIREHGYCVALDDFGTGYSSLSYLQKFPVDILKIDRSFVDEVDKNPNSAALVDTMVTMGRNLKIRVVAEGVETQDHLDHLRNNGCDYVQGYFISKPIPALEFEQFAKNYTPK